MALHVLVEGPFSKLAKQVEEQRRLYEALSGSSSHMAKWQEQEEKVRASLAAFEVPISAEKYRKAFELPQDVFASKAMQDVVESARKAREAFDVASLSERAGSMERAFQSISELRREPPRLFVPPPPPNPMLETNKQLKAVEEQAAGTRIAVNELGKMVSNLGSLGAQMHIAMSSAARPALILRWDASRTSSGVSVSGS